MLGPSTRDHEHSVDTNVVAFAHEAGREPLRRNRDASEALVVERESRCVLVTAGFHLDESERVTSTRDDIDFTARHACAASKNAPAPKP